MAMALLLMVFHLIAGTDVLLMEEGEDTDDYGLSL